MRIPQIGAGLAVLAAALAGGCSHCHKGCATPAIAAAPPRCAPAAPAPCAEAAVPVAPGPPVGAFTPAPPGGGLR